MSTVTAFVAASMLIMPLAPAAMPADGSHVLPAFDHPNSRVVTLPHVA